ncbi:MAG: helix-turn-helix domain-containing protein [Bacilli bacterium]
MKLGEKIKLLRKSKKISQEELSNMLKINRNYLSRIETGKSEPTSSVLKNIALIFNVDLNSLLDINEVSIKNAEKIKYIVENCKYLHEKDVDFIVRIMTVMKEEYVKINTKTD